MTILDRVWGSSKERFPTRSKRSVDVGQVQCRRYEVRETETNSRRRCPLMMRFERTQNPSQ